MKRLLPFLLCIALFACSKKETPKPTVSLVGTWYATKLTAIDYTTTPNQTENISYSHTDYIKFNADGTGAQQLDIDNIPFTYTTKNDSVAIIFHTNTKADLYKIVSLTNTSLDLLVKYSSNGTLQESVETTFAK